MRTMLLPALGVAAVLLSAQSSPTDGLQPGSWTQTFTVQLKRIHGEDVDGAPPDTNAETVCYSAADVADPQRILLAGAEQQCTVSHFAMTGGKVSMSVSCAFTPDQTMSGDLQGSYSPAAFDLGGTMTSTGDGSLAVNATMSARRAGDCP